MLKYDFLTEMWIFFYKHILDSILGIPSKKHGAHGRCLINVWWIHKWVNTCKTFNGATAVATVTPHASRRSFFALAYGSHREVNKPLSPWEIPRVSLSAWYSLWHADNSLSIVLCVSLFLKKSALYKNSPLRIHTKKTFILNNDYGKI